MKSILNFLDVDDASHQIDWREDTSGFFLGFQIKFIATPRMHGVAINLSTVICRIRHKHFIQLFTNANKSRAFT